MPLPLRGLVGAAALIGGEVLLFAGHPVVAQWFTPLAWTAYIFLVDAILERVTGTSPMTRVPAHVAWSAVASVAIWYLFEAYNLRMDGWRYVGLPESYPLRVAGYFWAFATIGPGMFLTRELVQVLLVRRGRGAASRGATASPGAAASPAETGSPGAPYERSPHPRRVPTALLWASAVLGVVCLVSPFVVSQPTSRYLWAPVWAGFIFLVDPINAALGRGSIWRDLFARDGRRLVSLLLAGLVCGGLWELWNYWASAKWIYTFPLGGLEDAKLFEMPVLGFFGFPPFAIEYYALTELVAVLWKGDADFGAPGFRRR